MAESDLSRRAVLKATGGAVTGLALVGTAQASEGSDKYDSGCAYDTATMSHHGGDPYLPSHEGNADVVQYALCSERGLSEEDHDHAKSRPGHTMKHFDANVEGCPTGTGLGSDCTEAEWPDCTNWPDPTIELVKESREALTEVYDDVGTLIAEGYIPYFDVLLPGATGGVSHWLNPAYINDTTAKPDPWKPESVMMENRYWSPIGPMFIGTDEGELIHDVDTLWGYTDEVEEGDIDYDDGISENDDQEVIWHAGYDGPTASDELENVPCGPCYPMHGHDGLPGRFAWWYYRQVHEADYASGEVQDLTLPCYTAPMMHAWIFPTEAGPHSPTAGAPTKRYEPGRTPNRPGYPTPATPGEDRLSMEVLPESVQERAMPDRLAAELEVIESLPAETLRTATIGELERLMVKRLGPADSEATDVSAHLLDAL